MSGDGDFPKKSRIVPPADSTRNYFQEEVVGNKTDAAVTTPTTTKSLMGYMKGALNQLSTIIGTLDDSYHSAQKVYPTAAAPVTVTSGVGAWTLGNYIEIVPINTITGVFDIRWAVINDVGANTHFELVLYAGTTEIARLVLTKTSAWGSSQTLPIQTPLIPANSQIQAKMMDGVGGSTLQIKLQYHL